MADNQYQHPIFWHAHQGLANARLVQKLKAIRPRVLGKWLVWILIYIDSMILLLRAMWFRVTKVGFRARLSRARKVVWLDLGTHERGEELRLAIDQFLPKMVDDYRGYGFEASTDTFTKVAPLFECHSSVELIHTALCYRVPDGGFLKLHKAENSLSDSLYGESNVFEKVPAIKLSGFLNEQSETFHDCTFLLRMNVEGAEFDIVRDLVESGWSEKIAGWFGMWDDLSKADPPRDNEFRDYLARHGIRKSTFNGRDLDWPLRVFTIGYEIKTSLANASRAYRQSSPDS